jgi:hypothetical protein
VILIASVIACLIAYLLPSGQSEVPNIPTPSLPDINDIPTPSLPGIPGIPSGTPSGTPVIPGPNIPGITGFPSGNVVPPGTTPGTTPGTPSSPNTDGTATPSPAEDYWKSQCPIKCDMRCYSNDECPAGTKCIGGKCQCPSKVGGCCKKPTDCDCRMNLRCDMPSQKCVPGNFYHTKEEAVEMCQNGYRRGTFYDPYEYLVDSTQGYYVDGFKCNN